jgi:hypothetical protein
LARDAEPAQLIRVGEAHDDDVPRRHRGVARIAFYLGVGFLLLLSRLLDIGYGRPHSRQRVGRRSLVRCLRQGSLFWLSLGADGDVPGPFYRGDVVRDRFDTMPTQGREQVMHTALGVRQPMRAPAAPEHPTHPLQRPLAPEIVRPAVGAVILVTVELDS